MRRAAGPFTAQAEVTGTKTDSALFEFMKELKAIRDTVPADELAKAKRYLQLGLPQDFETTGSIAFQMLPLVTYGLPLNFYDTAVQKIGAVTQADVQRVARKYVDPDRLTIVIVGDRKLIEPGLRALNPGEIIIRDVRDVIGAVPVK
jgi:predicted Zn-dependent peptidase